MRFYRLLLLLASLQRCRRSGNPVDEHNKVWKEMVRRYFAGVLGLLIVCIAVQVWRDRRSLRQSP